MRGKHADCAKVGINSIRRDLPADISRPNSTRPSTSSTPTGLHRLHRSAAAAQAPGRERRAGTRRPRQGRRRPAPDQPGPAGAQRASATALHAARHRAPAAPVRCVQIAGAHVVVIGRGVTVGRPLGLLLTRRSENATVTLCHTGTRDLPALTRQADIIVAAVGVPHMVTADMVRPGAAVVDVGVSRVDGKLTGDVHPGVWEVAGHVSPNPGGVGPLTRAFLLTNVVERAERERSQSRAAERPRARVSCAVAHPDGGADLPGRVPSGGGQLLAARCAADRDRCRCGGGVASWRCRTTGPGCWRCAPGASTSRRRPRSAPRSSTPPGPSTRWAPAASAEGVRYVRGLASGQRGAGSARTVTYGSARPVELASAGWVASSSRT